MKDEPLIDFVICTHNREAILRLCLDALIPQLKDDRVVMTVVDNKSTDNTVNMLSSYKKQYTGLRYVLEKNVGLSHARNTGWQTSSAQWIYYLDDDCLAPPGLVAKAMETIRQHDEAAAIGGPIAAIYSETPPAWFPATFGSFAIDTSTYRELDHEYIRGGNMMIRREVLEAVGGFDVALGVQGNSLRYGEELLLQHRMREQGYRIGYEPGLVMNHFVRPDKMRVLWLLASEYARRRDKLLIAPEPVTKTTLMLARTLLMRIVYVPYFLSRAVFVKRYHSKAALFEALRPVAYRFGAWVGSVKRLRK